MWPDSLSSQKKINWPPINLTELRERVERVVRRCLGISGLPHNCPPRGSEQAVPRWRRQRCRRPRPFIRLPENLQAPNRPSLRSGPLFPRTCRLPFDARHTVEHYLAPSTISLLSSSEKAVHFSRRCAPAWSVTPVISGECWNIDEVCCALRSSKTHNEDHLFLFQAESLIRSRRCGCAFPFADYRRLISNCAVNRSQNVFRYSISARLSLSGRSVPK